MNIVRIDFDQKTPGVATIAYNDGSTEDILCHNVEMHRPVRQKPSYFGDDGFREYELSKEFTITIRGAIKR